MGSDLPSFLIPGFVVVAVFAWLLRLERRFLSFQQVQKALEEIKVTLQHQDTEAAKYRDNVTSKLGDIRERVAAVEARLPNNNRRH